MARLVDYAAICDFLAKRRKSTGGYGATPRLPATIEDTFEAVEISRCLPALAPGCELSPPPSVDSSLHAYLEQVLARTWPGLRTTYQLLTACRHLNLPIDPLRTINYLRSQPDIGEELLSGFYAAAICRLLKQPQEIETSRADISLPKRLTAAALHHYLLLQKFLGHQPGVQAERLISWLQKCQNGDGGFGFFPRTTSFIENSHHALASLKLLGGTPKDPENGRQFIISCQTGSGGFGRSPRATAFLDSTWHSLAALSCLPT